MDFGNTAGSSRSSMRRKSILGAFLPRDRSSTVPQQNQPPAPPPSSYHHAPSSSSLPPLMTASGYSTFSTASSSTLPQTTEESYSHYPESSSGHSTASNAFGGRGQGRGHTRNTSYGGETDQGYYPSPGGSTGPKGIPRAPSSASSSFITTGANRSVSGMSVAQSQSRTTSMGIGMGAYVPSSAASTPSGKGGQGDGVKRVEDAFRLVKDRVFGWSYLMQWYHGDVHYLNTVKVSPYMLEQSLGPKTLESRSKSFFVLGLSLAGLLDETDAAQYCRSLVKVLDEWDAGLDGGGKVKNLFRGPKSRKSNSLSGGFLSETQDGFSGVLDVHLPFVPDFFQVHSTTCSIIRDTYKKLLKHLLPRGPGHWNAPAHDPLRNLTHKSTVIHSAPLDPGPSRPTQPVRSGSSSSSNFRSPAGSSIYEGASSARPAGTAHGQGFPETSSHQEQAYHDGGTDGFQEFVIGRLPDDRMLVGDGQGLSRELADLISKIDARFKKIFSRLLHEGYDLARETLDTELNMLLNSLSPGSKPMRFDLSAAMSGQGNGFRPPGSSSSRSVSAQHLPPGDRRVGQGNTPQSSRQAVAPGLSRKLSVESSASLSFTQSPSVAGQSRDSTLPTSTGGSTATSSPLINGPTRTTSRTSLSTPALSSSRGGSISSPPQPSPSARTVPIPGDMGDGIPGYAALDGEMGGHISTGGDR